MYRSTKALKQLKKFPDGHLINYPTLHAFHNMIFQLKLILTFIKSAL